MTKKGSKSDYDHGVWLTLKLDKVTNQMLTDSANRSNRPKKKEALIRIQDHLADCESIAVVGDATRRRKEVK